MGARKSSCSFVALMEIFSEIPVDVWTGVIWDLLAAHRKGSNVLRDKDAGGSVASLASSYFTHASLQRKKVSEAEIELNGAITSVRNGGRGIAFVKCMMVGFASRAASKLAVSVIELMVVQLGVSTSLMVRMDLGQNLMGTALGPKPVSPKYSTFGLSRSPPILDNWWIIIISSFIGDLQRTALTLRAMMLSSIFAFMSGGSSSLVITLKISTTELCTLFRLLLSTCLVICSSQLDGFSFGVVVIMVNIFQNSKLTVALACSSSSKGDRKK